MKSTALLLLTLFFVLIGSSRGQQQFVIIEDTYSIKGGEFNLKIDVDGGKVTIKRSEDRRDCYVYLKFNKDKADGDIRFNKKRNRMEVIIDQNDWISLKDKDKEERSNYAKLYIELPSKPEINLQADIKAGEIDFTLGGLYLKNFELRNLAGEVKIDFDKPNRTKLESFDVNCKVGEMRLLNLGNANFREADINGGIGEMRVDFRGERIKRAVANIDLDIGETTIIVPRDVAVKMRVSKFVFLSEVDYPNWFNKKGKYYYSKNYSREDKSLYLHISSGIGELKLRVD